MQALAAEVKERLEGTCVYLVGMMGRWVARLCFPAAV